MTAHTAAEQTLKRHAMRSRGAWLLALMLGLATLSPAPAWAHEGGVLKLATQSLTAGDSLAITGAKFSKRASLHIVLVGLGGRFALLDVTTDTKGAFTTRVLVPADAAPGSYRVVAVAEDGDEVATVDVALAAAGAVSVMAEPAATGPPTNQALDLVPARSAMVTFGAIVAILLAIAAAAVLLRRRPDLTVSSGHSPDIDSRDENST